MKRQLLKKLNSRYQNIEKNNAKNTPSFTAFKEWFTKRWTKNKKCEYCQRKIDINDNKWPYSKQLSIDHRTPLAHGGDNRLSNLAITCVRCNMIKTTMKESTFRELLYLIGHDENLLEKILYESNKGRTAYKLERLEKINHSVLQDIPENLIEQYLPPHTNLFCPDCNYPLSAYLSNDKLICLNCSTKEKEKTFKVIETR